MTMKWFRMYAEFAYDAKVQCLSETLQRRYVMLLCLQCNDELEKLTAEELAFTLRISPDELVATLATLADRRLMDAERRISGWEKRQYKSDTSTDRVRRHRAAASDETLPKRGGNGGVTAPDSETDSEKKRRYAFDGLVIRLTEADLVKLTLAYHAIPDMTAELTAIDAKFVADPPKPKQWFGKLNGWLKAEHTKRLAMPKPAAQPYRGPELRANVKTL